jgi:PAS domain S-box-containing protein
MGERIRAFDWSKTVLGPADTWSPALRTTLRILLVNRFPHILWWGPQYIQFYNDPYRPIPGTKHPHQALGRPASECWFEIWHVIGPLIDRPFNGGPATWDEDIFLEVNRHGFVEETHFTIAYSPVPDDTVPSGIGGVLATVHEITEKIIGERRVVALRDLGARVSDARTAEEACEIAAETLARHDKDIPFALLYLLGNDGKQARLAGAAGVKMGEDISPLTVDLSRQSEILWPLAQVLNDGTFHIVENFGRRFHSVPCGPWSDPPNTAVIMPIPSHKAHEPAGIMVAGVSCRLEFDAYYRDFFELVRTQIATAIANARAYEHERKRAEELAEIDRLKTAFFSNVSHEFRTPLTLMLGPIQEMRQGGDNSEQIELLYRNSLRLLKLVNTLLDFSRIEAGRIEASYEPTDLATYTVELTSVFRSTVEKAGLSLNVDCPPLPQPAYVDRQMWEKIVFNLLSNALKFTFNGEIDVSLRWRGERIELIVRDTGVGIPESELSKVFQRFFRVRGTAARTHEGTGIGLALIEELARLHGGEARVESSEGQGSTFTISIRTGRAHLPEKQVRSDTEAALVSGALPFIQEALLWLPRENANPLSTSEDGDLGGAEAAAIEERGITNVSAGDTSDGSRPRILLADDNADMRDYLQRILASRYDVEAVADGQAALESIYRRAPDLVLSDIMMPRIDGLGFLQRLRAGETTRALPVIMLSARAGEEAQIEGLNAGADDYLVKPFSARELLARVESQLKLARLHKHTQEQLRRLNEYLAERISDLQKARLKALHLAQEAERAKQVIRNRAEQFETLVNRAPLGVYLVDADFRIAQVNPVAQPAFSNIAGGVIGRDFEEVMRALWNNEYAEEVIQIFRHTLETGESFETPERIEYRIDRGVTEYYEWRTDRMTLPDGRYGVICYFRDISAQVQARIALSQYADQLKEADRRKDEFLATLSHELRNPLAPIRNAVEILKAPQLDADKFQMAREIAEHQVSHMARLIDDLMDIGRISRGKIALKRERVALKPIVDQAIETSKPHIEENGHQLSVSLPSSAVYLQADPVRLAQVLSNLINNACKYSDKDGKIEIRASLESIGDFGLPIVDSNSEAALTLPSPIGMGEGGTESMGDFRLPILDSLKSARSGNLSNDVKKTGKNSETPGEGSIQQSKIQNPKSKIALVLSVKDAGIGIAPEHLPRLFEMFSQVESAMERSQGGLGIGLSLVKGLVELHGGEVEAKSNGIGEGSEFIVRLPVLDVEGDEGRVASDNTRRALPNTHHSPARARPLLERIMVVDDNRAQAQSLTLLLDSMGFEVRSANDGASALALVESFDPQVAMVDLGLSDMTGHELARRITQIHKNIILIAQTGWGRDKDRELSRQAGFQHHLTKPVDPAVLENILRQGDHESAPQISIRPQPSVVSAETSPSINDEHGLIADAPLLSDR